MLNKIILMGRLTRDPELRRTQSGTAVTSFSLAVDRDFKSQGGDSLLTLCRVDDENDLVIGRNLCHVCTSFWTNGPHSR